MGGPSTPLPSGVLWLSMQRMIKKAKIAFVMIIISQFSGKITLYKKYAPGQYEEEVYYNIYVPSASEHSRRSTETLCRRNVLITNTMLFHIQNMFHSEIRIKLGNKNTALPQFLPVLWSSCVLYWSWSPRPQSHCTGNGKELLIHLVSHLSLKVTWN